MRVLMPKRTKKLLLAALLICAASFTTLLARRATLPPQRPVPEFRTIGTKAAEIQIYEYTDFACPACRAAHYKLLEMVKLYNGHVALNFKHFPLEVIHKWSFTAAAYADCAGEQRKFREYAGLLFENPTAWAKAKQKPAEFADYGKRLGLDLAALEACSVRAETIKRVKLDITEGDLKGVNATPTFFVNGRRAVGAGQLLDSAKHFDNIINRVKNGRK